MKRSGLLAFATWAAATTVCAAAAEPSSYPFEGSWVRSDRTCSATATRERIYTPRDVVSSRSHCVIRKVVTGPNASFELFERCERPNERPLSVSETIRMTGPDSMVLTRQTTRLKLSRALHFTRCPTPAPNTVAPTKPAVPPATPIPKALPAVVPKPTH